MKLSDYVWQYLANLGVTHVFGVVGGANSHLADSLGRNQRLSFIPTQHEQAAAMAAEGYARVTGKLGVVLVTSGPGGSNALTGVAGAWCDSVPLIVISGQLPLALTTNGQTIRQLGVQQINIADWTRPVSKYAAMPTTGELAQDNLREAVALAINGRPGPVWLDIPTDVQRAEVRLASKPLIPTSTPAINSADIITVLKWLSGAQRPVIIAGQGIRLAGAVTSFRELVESLAIPVITTWNGIDLINHSHPLYRGCAGVMGQRGANYTVANADLLLCIGSRLDTRQVGNSPELYARSAKKIVVDIDHHELAKQKFKIDLPIVADAHTFIRALLAYISLASLPNKTSWIEQTQRWQQKYSVVPTSDHEQYDRINSFVFIDQLARLLEPGDIIVTDMGTSLTCTMQTFTVQSGQRLFTNTGFAPMGFGLPGAIGAWFGGSGRRVVLVAGDGGFQMNIQELQTVVHHQLPLKIFILNNRSYLTIKHTQEAFFARHYVGSEPNSGYSAPSFTKIANAYGINAASAHLHSQLDNLIKAALATAGPTLCEVMMDPDQPLIPISMLDKSRGYAGSPLERMYPFLPEEEHRANMLIPVV